MDIKEKQEKLRKQASGSIVYERLKKKMSQSELAEKVGTQRSNISRIESGEQNISLDLYAKIQYALGNDVSLEVREEALSYFENEIYSLKLYDEELLRFSLKRGIGLEAKIISVNEERKYLLPSDLKLTSEGLFKWLDRRIIPSNREFVGEILSSMRLERGDVKGIIDVCKGLSLNDSYWVVPADSDLKFDKYNLYENDFAEILALVAYTGRPYSDNKLVSSPEFTTNGVLRKAWRKIDGSIWLYKGGTQDFANAGNEPFCEFYACQIAEAMGLNAVHYELDSWKGITASKCLMFTDKDTSYVPVGKLVNRGGIEACIKYYKRLGDSFYDDLCSMLVFDYIVLNEDRHFGNFGLLRDNHTGKYVATAPVFDNGNSLLCYAMDSDFFDAEGYIAGRSVPYGISFEELLKLVCGPKQKAQARNLINFKFKESDKYNLPQKRLRLLEEIIQDRVKKVLTIK